MRRVIGLSSAVAIATVGLLGASGSSAVALATPTVRVGDVQVTEGDAGNAKVNVPVDLSGPSDTVVKVPFQVKLAGDGSADAQDAILKTGTLTYLIGTVSKPISVIVVGDASPELDQHIVIQLGVPVGNAIVVDPEGGLTITDDDANGVNPGVEASIGDVTVTESDAGAHYASLPIVLSRPAPIPMSVGFVTDCSTASMLTDVTARRTGRISFLAGQRSKVLTFKITADTNSEDVESFAQSITAGIGGLTVLASDGAATILDNDGSFHGGGSAVPGFATETLPSGSTFDAGTVGQIDQISIGYDGSAPHYPTADFVNTFDAGTSADGSHVLFQSDADNLVPGDTNGAKDLFVRDRTNGTTERVTLKADGSQITTADTYGVDTFIRTGSISASGRYIAYVTGAALVPGDTPVGASFLGKLDVYVYDRVAHTTELASAMADGTAAGGAYGPVSISANGRYVAYTVHGYETKLMTTNSSSWGFVHDRQTGSNTQVLSTPIGRPLVISADGRTVVTASLGPTCDENDQKLVAIDLATGSTDRIDVTANGQPAAEGLYADNVFSPTVSANGRFVGFNSFAWNMIPGMTGPVSFAGAYPEDMIRTYVRDRQAGTTSMIPPAAPGWPSVLSIDDGGTHLVSGAVGPGRLFNAGPGTYQSYGLPLVPNVGPFVEVRTDRSLSGDGRVVVFASRTPHSWGFSGEVYAQRVN